MENLLYTHSLKFTVNKHFASKKSTIDLDAISNYHTFIWHASYGYTGTSNHDNILNLSPFLEYLMDDSFDKIEINSGHSIQNRSWLVQQELCFGWWNLPDFFVLWGQSNIQLATKKIILNIGKRALGKILNVLLVYWNVYGSIQMLKSRQKHFLCLSAHSNMLDFA